MAKPGAMAKAIRWYEPIMNAFTSILWVNLANNFEWEGSLCLPNKAAKGAFPSKALALRMAFAPP